MADHPILFSGPMVRALLAGTKTQTRRIVKWRDLAPGLNLSFTGLHVHSYTPGTFTLESRTRTSWESRSSPTRCPYGVAGDRLWVRETWQTLSQWMDHGERFIDLARNDTVGRFFEYAATNDAGWSGPWRPSIHMPRHASRTMLLNTGVRVERLKDLTREDAIAEGIVQLRDGGFGLADTTHYHFEDPRQSYFSLFEAINGPGSVEANPWLWVVSFPRVA